MSLRARGFEVGMAAVEGGHALAISGPPELMEALWHEVMAQRRSKPPRVLTGTVRWWKDEKGYGRITGDDGYIYFSHFSALQWTAISRYGKVNASSSQPSKRWPITGAQAQPTFA